MNRRLIPFVCVLLLVPLVACQEETPNAPPPVRTDAGAPVVDAEQIASGLLARTGWPSLDDRGNPVAIADVQAIDPDKCLVISAERQMITETIAHYAFIVQIGPGCYDRIGVHRVVKEDRPCRPIRTRRPVFLQHGASTDFVYCYLPGLYSVHTPDDFGFAVYLASNDVDVWGIDQRWCLVPPEETDVSFMATWDLPMHIADLGLGVDVARTLRRMTGNSWDRMLLLGFSFGAEISFGVLDADTQLPPGHRRIKGYIPVDMVIRVPPEGSPWRELMCSWIPYYEGQLAAGVYGEGALFRPAGILARDDPDGDSPFFPGLTNYQAALAIGTTLLYGVPPFHLFAGIFDGDLPVGMDYISNEAWIEFLCRMSAVESNVASLDQAHEICGRDVSGNRHWAQIDVPIFFVAPRGGFGEAGLYQLSMLGSDEVSTLIISTHPDDALLDFGHLALFLGDHAETLVWGPILDWIVAHTHGGHHRAEPELF